MKNHNNRVLVVDDNSDHRFLHKKILNKIGFEVDEAESGEDAISFLKAKGNYKLANDTLQNGIEYYFPKESIYLKNLPFFVSEALDLQEYKN